VTLTLIPRHHNPQVGELSESYTLPSFDAEMSIGGWEVRETKLGDALYESRVLDYDLVRQVRRDVFIYISK